MTEQNMNTVVNIRIPASLRNKLNSYLRETGQNISEFMRNRIDEYLNEKYTKVPFIETEPVETTCRRHLEEVIQAQQTLEKCKNETSGIPHFSVYSTSGEEYRIEQLESFIRSLHRIVDQANSTAEGLCDIAIESTKTLIGYDQKLRQISSSIYEALQSSEAINPKDVWEQPPHTFSSIRFSRATNYSGFIGVTDKS